MDFLQVDFINSVCPCAGLSMLNTSTAAGIAQKQREPTVLVLCPNTSHFSSSGQKRGSDSKANQWMLDSSAFVLARIRPKV